jgi:CBS domain-containing protein
LICGVLCLAGVISVRDIMTVNVKTVHPDAAVIEAVQKMAKFDVGSIVVVDSSLRPVGIITERDVLRDVVIPRLPVDVVTALEVMSKPLISISPDVSVEQAAKLMSDKRIKKLPIVEGNKLVGIITSMDLVRTEPRLIEQLSDLICPYYPVKKSKK